LSLDQFEGPLASFTGDGAYDQDGVAASVAARHPEASTLPVDATTPREAPRWAAIARRSFG